ncbi:hypothetical protein MMC25_002149 [Agyrium rufum]|nr:hypothetical protein [Agyrium rufum]
MSSVNPDSSTNAQGPFKAKIAPSEPLTTSGHAVGTKVGNDAVPEFHAQTLPAGSAPADRTFKPNPVNETPGQAGNELAGRQHGKEDTSTSAADTLGGTTSGGVHTGIGKPIQGQTGTELDSNTGRSAGKMGQNTGLEGVGVTGQSLKQDRDEDRSM